MAINDPADSDEAPNERLITHFVNKNVIIAVFQNKSVLLTTANPKNFGLLQQQQLHIYMTCPSAIHWPPDAQL